MARSSNRPAPAWARAYDRAMAGRTADLAANLAVNASDDVAYWRAALDRALGNGGTGANARRRLRAARNAAGGY